MWCQQRFALDEAALDMRNLFRCETTWGLTRTCKECCAAYPQERVSFQPHPNTLTMAGELEYWAAQVGSQPAHTAANRN